MTIAVVGGGWAGLSAALALHDAGYRVEVYEVAPTLGGRARGVVMPGFTSGIDNGQHILLGAYEQTLRLMQRLHRNPAQLFLRLPLQLKSARHDFELRCRDLPSPWHAAAGVLFAKGWRISEKIRLLSAITQLRSNKWLIEPDLPLAQWLVNTAQPQTVIRHFWEPLCLAALNTPVSQASTQQLARVLKDSLDAGTRASDALIPTTDLSDLWANHLPKSINVRTGHPVRQIEQTRDGYKVNGERQYDGLVVATPPAVTKRLLAPLPYEQNSQALLDTLATFEPVPIATLTLALKTPWHALADAMLMLDDSEQPGALGQWLFNHAKISDDPLRQAVLTVVISDCRELMKLDRAQAMAALIAQVTQQTGLSGPMPQILHQALIVEKRATFAATPGLLRPKNATPWPRLVLAGDWTDTGYPAVLEGAVRSGQAAARQMLEQTLDSKETQRRQGQGAQ